jgi:hypothetical protein
VEIDERIRTQVGIGAHDKAEAEANLMTDADDEPISLD